jgi:hypothetical protein
MLSMRDGTGESSALEGLQLTRARRKSRVAAIGNPE